MSKPDGMYRATCADSADRQRVMTKDREATHDLLSPVMIEEISNQIKSLLQSETLGADNGETQFHNHKLNSISEINEQIQ